MYVRRRLPKSKRAEIKAVIKSLQEELEPLAQNFDVDQKEAVLKRIRTLRVVVGAPDEFLDDDEVFDDLFFDFVSLRFWILILLRRSFRARRRTTEGVVFWICF